MGPGRIRQSKREILRLLGERSQHASGVSLAGVCLPWLSMESNAKLKGFGREIPRSHTSHDSCFQATSSSWHRALAYSNRGQFGGFCGLSWTLDSETVFRCGSEPISVSKLVRKERLVGRRVEFLFVLEFLPSLPCPLRCSPSASALLPQIQQPARGSSPPPQALAARCARSTPLSL